MSELTLDEVRVLIIESALQAARARVDRCRRRVTDAQEQLEAALTDMDTTEAQLKGVRRRYLQGAM